MTGFAPPVKYEPLGESSTKNENFDDGRTCRTGSVANISGRRYRLCPSPSGTQPASAVTTASMASRNRSTGSSGIARRCAERFMRAALASGRNTPMPPSASRNAFMPSNAACA